MLEPRGILEDCLRSFNKQFSDFPEEKWTWQILKELSTMQSSLQTQPCMVDQYRRFVVIRGRQDKIAPDWGGVSIIFFFFLVKDLTRYDRSHSSNGRISMNSASGTRFSPKRNRMICDLGQVWSKPSSHYNLRVLFYKENEYITSFVVL